MLFKAILIQAFEKLHKICFIISFSLKSKTDAASLAYQNHPNYLKIQFQIIKLLK